ncbi:MAG: LysM peptidoglycan-binding domain-containing protein [Phycisphaerae bacterium]|nr:LysM peptidoglycan-binding domain-containing protein [Phycisphaerae bacterium]
MSGNATRVFAGLATLIAVWITVYWLYEPAEPPITFAEVPATAQPRSPASPSPAVPNGPGTRPADGGPSALTPPTFREYVVRAGDTGWEPIAERVYGDRKLWQAVSRANPFVTPDRLVPGRTVLKIPLDPANIQGLPGDGPLPKAGGTAEPLLPASGPPAAPQAPVQSPPATEHVVGPRDTLSGIAKEHYGRSSLWKHIFDANRDRLDDPARLKPGMTLRIPPPPAPAVPGN